MDMFKLFLFYEKRINFCKSRSTSQLLVSLLGGRMLNVNGEAESHMRDHVRDHVIDNVIS